MTSASLTRAYTSDMFHATVSQVLQRNPGASILILDSISCRRDINKVRSRCISLAAWTVGSHCQMRGFNMAVMPWSYILRCSFSGTREYCRYCLTWLDLFHRLLLLQVILTVHKLDLRSLVHRMLLVNRKMLLWCHYAIWAGGAMQHLLTIARGWWNEQADLVPSAGPIRSHVGLFTHLHDGTQCDADVRTDLLAIKVEVEHFLPLHAIFTAIL